MTKKISVGYDGTPPSAEAVRWASDEASLRGAHLEIVYCYTVPATTSAAFGWPAIRAVGLLMQEAAANAATMRAALLERHPQLDVTTTVSAGPASADLMTDMAFDDLIVVGASTHHGAGAFWLSNTPRHLVRHSPCPVAVIRGSASRDAPDRVVVGIDSSASSVAALDWAGDQADRLMVDLVIVHAWSYPYVDVVNGTATAHDLLEVDAACALDQAREHARERFGCSVSGRLIEAAPVSALLEATRYGDLLVLGSRGRGALVGGMLGSTVNAVLDRALVPVVVVRNTDGEV